MHSRALAFFKTFGLSIFCAIGFTSVTLGETQTVFFSGFENDFNNVGNPIYGSFSYDASQPVQSVTSSLVGNFLNYNSSNIKLTGGVIPGLDFTPGFGSLSIGPYGGSNGLTLSVNGTAPNGGLVGIDLNLAAPINNLGDIAKVIPAFVDPTNPGVAGAGGYNDLAFANNQVGGNFAQFTITSASTSFADVFAPAISSVKVYNSGVPAIEAYFKAAGGASLSDAALIGGFTNFNWVQLVDIPSPSSGDFAPIAHPTSPSVGQHNDPVPSGYVYFNDAQHSSFNGWNSYPFYLQNDGSESQLFSVKHNTIIDQYIHFEDAPADPCLPPLPNMFGVLQGGYSFSLHLNATDPLVCGFGLPAPSGTVLSFSTYLVGVVAPGTACPPDGGTCYEQDSSNDGMPTPIPIGTICPVTMACYETFAKSTGQKTDYFSWSDSYNGSEGTLLGSNLYASDVTPLGVGAIEIQSIDGVPVPEPKPAYMLATFLIFLGLFKNRKFKNLEGSRIGRADIRV